MTRKECLEKAKKCVCGQREQEYGSPQDNFSLIADLWSAYLKSRGIPDIHLLPVDVAMMMTLLKIARVRTGCAKADTFIDGAGYMALGAELANAP